MNYMGLLDEHEKRSKEIADRKREIAVERQRLDTEEEGLDRENLGISEAIRAYQFLTHRADENPLTLDPETTGFTEAMRMILQSSFPTALLPVEIRDELMKHGYKGSTPKNLLINVHTTLTRLKDDLEEIQKGGKTAFRSKTPIEPGRVAQTLAQKFLMQQPSTLPKRKVWKARKRIALNELPDPATVTGSPDQKGGSRDATATIKK